MEAVGNKQWEIAEWLLEMGVDINEAAVATGYTVLHEMIACQLESGVRWALNHGADVRRVCLLRRIRMLVLRQH